MGVKGNRNPKSNKKYNKKGQDLLLENTQLNLDIINQQNLVDKEQQLRLHEKSIKIGGERYPQSKLNLINQDKTNYYHNISIFLGKTPHIIIDNPINTVNISFSNDRQMIFNNPNNYGNVSRNFSMFYIKHANCFLIRRDNLDEKIIGDIEAPIFEMPGRSSNHAERRIKVNLVRKCSMKKYSIPISTITFSLQSQGETWTLSDCELWTIGTAFYAIFGKMSTELTINVPQGIPLEESQRLLQEQDAERAKRVRRLTIDPRTSRRNAVKDLQEAAIKENYIRSRSNSRTVIANSKNLRKESMRIRNVGGNRH